MTTEASCLPLIARFAVKLSRAHDITVRYDPLRQVSEAWNGNEWVDAAQMRASSVPETRITKVSQETTDDS